MPTFGARCAGMLARVTIKYPTAAALRSRHFVRYYRLILAQMTLTFGRAPRAAVCRKETGGVAGEWFAPKSVAQDAPAILYLHGGGYIGGAVAQYRRLIGAIALRCGARTFAPEYRLAPECPFPAALDDAVEAYRFLLAQGERPARTFIGGDSAGGGLALSFLLAARDRGLPLPAGAFLLSPWTDLASTGESIRSNARSDDVLVRGEDRLIAPLYAGASALDDPRLSGLYADLRGLPPLLVQASASEMLRDDALRLAERARAAGVDASVRLWDGVPHVWQIFTSLRESREALADIAAFVREVSIRRRTLAAQ
ncbi:MAG: alpha/beta hydrolase [Candidatus Eremiobacteraeota bacterium]|nr:alpha/beta hydrolase [Candidatus Eremiobacteraeota bacterium]MBV8284454.1 alpha/beta hydrolase [Candidatus Eremiobacteraeota bacterium]MBV8655405.1 alpha/beta hydrolase [Candidatus Eremiobacteraeota bacterium]